jgi:hypothetical protein
VIISQETDGYHKCSSHYSTPTKVNSKQPDEFEETFKKGVKEANHR